mmetsp:Transcript_238/g.1928  ORF Transcript_238/g.1928 Transcript_238/m.1928 type:complete len:96 (-) Transcript_238:658-945(-)
MSLVPPKGTQLYALQWVGFCHGNLESSWKPCRLAWEGKDRNRGGQGSCGFSHENGKNVQPVSKEDPSPVSTGEGHLTIADRRAKEVFLPIPLRVL